MRETPITSRANLTSPKRDNAVPAQLTKDRHVFDRTSLHCVLRVATHADRLQHSSPTCANVSRCSTLASCLRLIRIVWKENSHELSSSADRSGQLCASCCILHPYHKVSSHCCSVGHVSQLLLLPTACRAHHQRACAAPRADDRMSPCNYTLFGQVTMELRPTQERLSQARVPKSEPVTRRSLYWLAFACREAPPKGLSVSPYSETWGISPWGTYMICSLQCTETGLP